MVNMITMVKTNHPIDKKFEVNDSISTRITECVSEAEALEELESFPVSKEDTIKGYKVVKLVECMKAY